MRSDGKQYEDTILHALLNNDELRREEKSLGRLADEAKILVGAGSESTARAISYTIFYVLHAPEVLQKL
jgi:cytochrome P450